MWCFSVWFIYGSCRKNIIKSNTSAFFQCNTATAANGVAAAPTVATVTSENLCLRHALMLGMACAPMRRFSLCCFAAWRLRLYDSDLDYIFVFDVFVSMQQQFAAKWTAAARRTAWSVRFEMPATSNELQEESATGKLLPLLSFSNSGEGLYKRI